MDEMKQQSAHVQRVKKAGHACIAKGGLQLLALSTPKQR